MGFTYQDIYRGAIYNNSATLCLSGTLPCVDFMYVTMGDLPLSEGFKRAGGRGASLTGS